MDSEFNKIMQKVVINITKEYSPQEILLYGSYAKGSNTEDSDIDLAVIFNSIEDKYFETVSKIFQIVSTIDSRIETVLLIKTHDKSGFIEHIKNYGITLYKN